MLHTLEQLEHLAAYLTPTLWRGMAVVGCLVKDCTRSWSVHGLPNLDGPIQTAAEEMILHDTCMSSVCALAMSIMQIPNIPDKHICTTTCLDGVKAIPAFPRWGGGGGIKGTPALADSVHA